MSFFGLSWYSQYDGQIVYLLEGRAFVLQELQKLVIGASGGYASGGLWSVWKDMPLWEVVETIELVSMVQAKDR